MKDKDYSEIFNIIIELQNEFVNERDKVSVISRENSMKIEELEQQIDTYRKNEDIDFRVFSPRNISRDNSEKISSLENEKSVLEREKKDADRQIGYYTAKAEKLEKVISILKNNITNEDSLLEYDSIKSSPKYDPFAFLNDEEDEKVEPDSEVIIDNEDASSDDILNSIINDSSEDEKDNIIESKSVIVKEVHNGIPVDMIERVCHRINFTEKIINNDRVRAKLELKEIGSDLNELINNYKNEE